MSIDRDASRRPRQFGQIEALTPDGPGHRFVVCGDSCSGMPGAPHEATRARVNAVVARLSPPPEFVVYTGDEFIGLTPDESELRARWRRWLDREMAWLDREAIPLYHATGNHTTYDAMSERVFADVLRWLLRNGPPAGSAARGTSRRNGSNGPCAGTATPRGSSWSAIIRSFRSTASPAAVSARSPPSTPAISGASWSGQACS